MRLPLIRKRVRIAHSSSNGVAIMTVLFFLLIAFPLVIVGSRMISQLRRASVQDVTRRGGVEAANSGIMEVMRQFSNDQYAAYSSTDSHPLYQIGKGKIEYQNTFSA